MSALNLYLQISLLGLVTYIRLILKHIICLSQSWVQFIFHERL